VLWARSGAGCSVRSAVIFAPPSRLTTEDTQIVGRPSKHRLEPPRPAQQIGPESTQVVYATGSRAEHGGVAYQQVADERVWSRLP